MEILFYIKNALVRKNKERALGCFIISPFLKLKMLGVSSGRILVTIKENKILFDRTLFRGPPKV